MDQQRKNKEFIVNYYNALSGTSKTREMLEKYISDPALIGHAEFFDKVFPNYEVVIDEMTAEGNRVIVKARTIGTHLGEFAGIPPTYKTIDYPLLFATKLKTKRLLAIGCWLIR